MEMRTHVVGDTQVDALTAAAVGLFSIVVGLAVVGYPVETGVVAAGIWLVAALLCLPRRLSIAAPLCFLLLIPADHMTGLNGSAHGLFALGATALFAFSTLLRDRLRGIRRMDWDLYLLAGMLSGATLLHARSGEVRGVLFWLAGCMALFWIRAEERNSASPARQVEEALVAAGAIGGGFAILERLGALNVHALSAIYRPETLELSYDMGERAAGLSGHPLRLGTLTMLATIVALVWLVHRRLTGRTTMLTIGALFLSLAGLVLSGARGSWLALVIAVLVIVFSLQRAGARRRLGILASIATITAPIVLLTGTWRYFYERIVGAASHPGSIDQRIQALEGISRSWPQLPLLGLGFGGAPEFSVLMGLKVLNLENEYLRLLLAAGVPALVLLAIVASRRFVAGFRQLPSPSAVSALACMAAMVVNLGTYNFFSWSIGPSLFFALCFLASPVVRRSRACPDGIID